MAALNDGRGCAPRMNLRSVAAGWSHRSAAGAAANRVALEACVKARNEGRQLEKESRDILTEAARTSPELAMAMETWKEIVFEFETVDKLDVG